MYRYQPVQAKDEPVIQALHMPVDRCPAYGFPKLFKILRRWNYGFNRKRVHYLLNLNKRRRGKKRIHNRDPVLL